MKKFRGMLQVIIFLSMIFIFSQHSFALSITREWISKDESNATIVVKAGESIELPKKGGGTITVSLTGGVEGSVTIKDYKDKRGNITYDNPGPLQSGLQSVSGTIDEGYGKFEIITTGNFTGLFSNVTVYADLIDSTGFSAQIGLPGDQLLQGGSISYSTEWFSDQAIGIDPGTGEEIILGDFFLDSTDPLTVFNYSDYYAEFTTGEVYRFSSGLEIIGTVTKEMSIVPEPSTYLLFLLGILGMVGIKRF